MTSDKEARAATPARSPYADENGVPRNKLGITDARALRQEEYRLTRSRALELMERPVVGVYDLSHLKNIHHHLFQDVYEWAGQIRTINFSKRSETHPGFKGVFAPVTSLPHLADKAHEFTASRDNLKGMNNADFVLAVSHVYASWNYIHPFPEGNGRSTQLFIAQLAKEAGHELDYSKVSRERWNAAASASMEKTHMRAPGQRLPADMNQIRQVFSEIVVGRDRAAEAPSRPGPER